MAKIKIIGVTRCCRQVMLRKMYNHEEPFQSIRLIALDPATYNDKPVLQLHVNDIDIGFVSQRDLQKISSSTICYSRGELQPNRQKTLFLFSDRLNHSGKVAEMVQIF